MRAGAVQTGTAFRGLAGPGRAAWPDLGRQAVGQPGSAGQTWQREISVTGPALLFRHRGQAPLPSLACLAESSVTLVTLAHAALQSISIGSQAGGDSLAACWANLTERPG